MNALKLYIGIIFLALTILSCGSDQTSNQENNQEISSDTIIEEQHSSTTAIDPLILGIWKLNNSALNGEMIAFQSENSGLKTWYFKEDGTFEEHQVIENEMVVGNGTYKTMDGSLVTSIETDSEPLVVNYTIELLGADSLVVKGTEESAAFTFYYVKAE